MPSPPKDRPSGRLGRLLAALRPSRAGPLPVQTGFPTSLADLVVKNHGRLSKKQPSPSSKRHGSGKRAAASAASTSPSLSPSPSTPASPSPPPASPPAPPPAAAVAVSPSDRPRPADLTPAAWPPRRSGNKGGGFGLGLGFLAVSGVLSLALLVIWSKKVVAAVTVASFSLYLLESVRSSSSLPIPRQRRPRPAAVVTERRLCLDGRGRVSPIREVDDADTEPPARPSCCSDSDRASDACSILAAVEADESSGVLDESSNPKAKKKKSWKKLISASAKKLHRGRRSKEPGSSGSSFRSEGDGADDVTAPGGGGNAKAADYLGSRRGSSAGQTDAMADSSRGFRGSQGVELDDAAAPVEIEAAVDDLIEEELPEEEEVEEQAGIRFPALVLVAVVLAGLVAGKLLALALTVLSAAFLSSVQRSPPCSGGGGGGDCSQGRRLEPSMS